MTILYSFRRCPYAMRARMALLIKGSPLELREVLLRDKPPSMLALSPKGTVPVLQTAAGDVIEESLEIMCWAIPAESLWFSLADREQQLEQARSFDDTFKPHLDAYKYHRPDADRSREAYRELAAGLLDEFEANLHNHDYLLGFKPQFLDLAVMPFVRQFAAVDRRWFDAQHRQNLRRWLDRWLADPLFTGMMTKFPQWQEGSTGEVWPSILCTTA
ncbi:MAG: glutathione S-transferase N-terminal domain-containing protein [Pseudomonadota bacterium]|nr:glutathione S-transferase N-terminal domain-containing protein [Pseudomonadota bacterium]